MSTHPLVQGFAPRSVFAYREGQAADIEQFLRDVRQLAALLPERRHVFNRCADRYRFAVGFSAALLRGQVSLLPPNETPALIDQLVNRYPEVYCLSDQAGAPAVLKTVSIPEPSGSGPAAAPVPVLPGAQVAAVIFTSGSTGEPVPWRKTWGSLVRSALGEIDSLGVRAQSGMAVLGTVPPQHSYGLESTVLMAMHGGLALHARRPFYPADIRADLAALPRPRCLVTTPAHLRVLLAEPDDLPPADLLLCATEALSPQLAARAEARFAAPLHEIYGCTEAGQIATRRTVETDEWRALPGVALRADSKGTWVKGGHVETEVLHGRTADLVNIAGKRTSLAHLNFQLNSIEGVLDGVFVSPEGESRAVARLTAFVVAPGHSSGTLMNALRQRIDAAFLPRPLYIVDALPRSATGKLPRQALGQIAAGLGSRQEQGRR
jgi:acyl-coenzyme A synthetase/AMP-(fatty) acid ligase